MSNKLFTTVPVPQFPRSTFSLSRPVLFTPRMHKQYPVEIIEIIPGDGMRVHTEAYAKSQPLIAPTFAKMDTAQECYFVPCWQLSEHFDDFITGGERGEYNDKMPYVTVGTFFQIIDTDLGKITSEVEVSADGYNEFLTLLQDIMEQLDIMRSVPIQLPEFQLMPESGDFDADIADANYDSWLELNGHLENSSLRINLLPFGATLKAWCEFYRDENLCDDLYEMYWCGAADNKTDYRSMIGNCSVSLIGDAITDDVFADIEYLHALFGLKSRAWKKDYFTSALPFVQKGPDVMLPLDASIRFDGPNTNAVGLSWKKQAGQDGVIFSTSFPNTPISGVINGANIGTSIQNVRTAFKLEELFEADGRFGNRYPENTLGQFGVRTPDSRLPRCQFLGSNIQPVQIQQVIQQSSTDATSPQGNLAGLASSYGSNKLCKLYESMHGFFVSFACVRVHSLYQQGIHPMFSRYDRTEYAWPRFANLGEQPIYTKQLFVNNEVTEEEVFGYTPRYADYKSDTGSIHGLLKTTLNVWTMARRFANKPQLNEEFIYGRPRQDAWVVSNHLTPCFVMEIDFHVRANRVLPFYGQPHM